MQSNAVTGGKPAPADVSQTPCFIMSLSALFCSPPPPYSCIFTSKSHPTAPQSDRSFRADLAVISALHCIGGENGHITSVSYLAILPCQLVVYYPITHVRISVFQLREVRMRTTTRLDLIGSSHSKRSTTGDQGQGKSSDSHGKIVAQNGDLPQAQFWMAGKPPTWSELRMSHASECV